MNTSELATQALRTATQKNLSSAASVVLCPHSPRLVQVLTGFPRKSQNTRDTALQEALSL